MEHDRTVIVLGCLLLAAVFAIIGYQAVHDRHQERLTQQSIDLGNRAIDQLPWNRTHRFANDFPKPHPQGD